MTAPPAPRSPSRIVAALPTALAVVLLLVAGRWFAARWEAVVASGELPRVAIGWLALAFALLILHAGTALLIWHRVLRSVGASLDLRTALDSFAPSLLARYVPGKIWANTVRLALSRRAGVRYGATTGAILWETLIALGSAGVVSLAVFALLTSRAEPAAVRGAALLVAITVAAFIVAWSLAKYPRGAVLLERFGSASALRSSASLAMPAVWSLLGWLVYGLAHWAIARSLLPALAIADFPLILGAVALAWAGGYLAFVMPVGLGVRDGILLVLLAPILDPAQALLFVALSRIVQLAVDATWTVGWLIRQTVTPRAAPDVPSA